MATSAFAVAAQRQPSADLEAYGGLSSNISEADSVRKDSRQFSLSLTRGPSLDREPSLERARWQSAICKVSRANSLSRSFRTLRDMTGESYIDPSRLKRLRELGTGAFATVELHELAPEGKVGAASKVAVKRIHPHLLGNKRELEAFANEAKLLRKLQHPNVVRYLGIGGDSDSLSVSAQHVDRGSNTLIVQEYLSGGSLKQLLLAQMCSTVTKKTAYTHADALVWVRQIAEGLSYLHTASPQVIHRDLKPENVLMRQRPDGKLEATLVDFGLSTLLRNTQHQAVSETQQLMERSKSEARRIDTSMEAQLKDCSDSASSRREANSAKLSSAGTNYYLTGRTGSFFYMPPEVTLSQPYNEKVDVFALAMLMQEIFSHTITAVIVVGPTLHPRAAELYALKVARGYRRPLGQSMPAPLQTLIQECWADRAEDRPTMEQCLQRLKAMEAEDIFSDDDAIKRQPACRCCCLM